MCEHLCFHHWSRKSLLARQRKAEIVLDSRVEIYGARQSLGMQGKDRQDCFHIIVPSSSSQRYAFVCGGFLFLSLCSSVCIFVRLCGTKRETEWQRRGNTERKWNIENTWVQICVWKREEEQRGERVKMEYRVYDSIVCVCVHVFTCPSSHGRDKAQNEIKSKQLYWWSP